MCRGPNRGALLCMHEACHCPVESAERRKKKRPLERKTGKVNRMLTIHMASHLAEHPAATCILMPDRV